MQKLWSKNFTIITIGSVVSMFGNNIANFALSLFVLDYTKSTLMFALYMILYTIPQLILPSLAGPFVDKFSRRKTIYTLDFISTGIFAFLAFLAFINHLDYLVVVCFSAILGAINSVYTVAYESFYPMLISEGNFTKAYSVSSTLECIPPFLIPVSIYIYKRTGMAPLFAINAVTFLIAAIMETKISNVKENYVKQDDEAFGFSQYKQNLIEGFKYLKEDKGLMAITFYFLITSFASSSTEIIGLPYFKESFNNGEYIFMCIYAATFIGRIAGGSLHYKLKIPSSKKFSIALLVYITVSIIGAVTYYLPFIFMLLFNFMDGILGVTSYNIRISSTQSYVPDEKKGRFNGTFSMLTMAGALVGQALSGFLGDNVSDKRLVVSIFFMINLIAVFCFIYLNKESVKKIYNRNV
ncbi:MAG: MFS transporter [Treponema sp.]|nr:MFS transporter [Treponema sp.]